MQPNNNISFEAIVLFCVLGVILYVVKIVIIIALSVVILLAAFMTILCLCALNRPVTFAGQVTTPEEANAFLSGGALGYLGAAAIGLIANTLGLDLSHEAIFLGAVVAYLGNGLSSVGELVQAAEKAREEAEAAASQQILLPPAPAQLPASRPFDFADWDDEKEWR